MTRPEAQFNIAELSACAFLMQCRITELERTGVIDVQAMKADLACCWAEIENMKSLLASF